MDYSSLTGASIPDMRGSARNAASCLGSRSGVILSPRGRLKYRDRFRDKHGHSLIMWWLDSVCSWQNLHIESVVPCTSPSVSQKIMAIFCLRWRKTQQNWPLTTIFLLYRRSLSVGITEDSASAERTTEGSAEGLTEGTFGRSLLFATHFRREMPSQRVFGCYIFRLWFIGGMIFNYDMFTYLLG